MPARTGGTTTTWPHDGHLSRFPACIELATSFFPQSQTTEIRCGLSGRPEFAGMNSPQSNRPGFPRWIRFQCSAGFRGGTVCWSKESTVSGVTRQPLFAVGMNSSPSNFRGCEVRKGKKASILQRLDRQRLGWVNSAHCTISYAAISVNEQKTTICIKQFHHGDMVSICHSRRVRRSTARCKEHNTNWLCRAVNVYLSLLGIRSQRWKHSHREHRGHRDGGEE